jgi:hypothetical protein
VFQVYFVGNAPMAHLDLTSSSSSSSAGSPLPSAEDAAKTSSNSSSNVRPPARVFFHLAQVVNDPWDVAIQDGAAASEFAWVGKEELGLYLKDDALLALAHKML